MNKKEVLILLALSLVPFLFYFGLRELPMGSDTFGYLSFSCQTTQQIGLSENLITFGSRFFFTHIPCSFEFIVFFEWLLFFLSILVLSKTGELFDEQNGWLYGLFLCVSMLGVTEFFKLEELTIAYPIIFLSFYFLLKYFKDLDAFIIPYNNKNNLYLYFILSILTVLFWKGAIILFFSSILVLPQLFLFAVTVFVFSWKELFASIALQGVQESRPFIGIIYSMFLLPFLMLSFMKFKTELKLMLLFFFLLLTVSMKFSLLIIPFSFLGISHALKHKKFGNITKYILIGLSVGSLIVFGLMTPSYPPTKEDIQAIEFAVNEADGNYISNDWSYGYWIIYFGGKTKEYAGGTQIDFNKQKGIIITNNNTSVNGKLLYETKQIKVWKKKYD